MARITLKVNGESHRLDVDGDTPLLWVLRDNLGLTGAKYGCGIAMCGACTVHVDGEAVRSCSLPVADAEGAEIVTIEGLGAKESHPLQRAWIAEDVPQCGYCQPGMIMCAAGLLLEDPAPDDDTISERMTVLCRCGTYQRVRAAIDVAARRLARGA